MVSVFVLLLVAAILGLGLMSQAVHWFSAIKWHLTHPATVEFYQVKMELPLRDGEKAGGVLNSTAHDLTTPRYSP